MATTKRIKSPIKSQPALSKAISYIVNPEKTTDERCLYVNSFNCSVAGADEQFKMVRDKWDKNSGNFAYHFIQSFKPGETTPDEAHQCGLEFAEALFANYGYQVVIGTHLDQEHLHNHFIVNAVNSLDGKKLQTDHDFIRKMRMENDRVCRLHNLSVIDNPQSNGKTYSEWIIDKNGGFTWRGAIKQDIDNLIPTVRTLKELLCELEKQGYTIRQRGKYLTLSPPGTNTNFRLYKLGKGYTEEDIANRIIYSNKRVPSQSKKTFNRNKRYRLNTSYRVIRHRGGFRGLYYSYVYKLRRIFNSTPSYQSKMPMQARHDAKLLHDFASDLQLLSDYKIDNISQLINLYNKIEQKQKSLFEERESLRTRLTSCDEQSDMKDIKEQINVLNQALKSIGKKKQSCERIFARSGNVQMTNTQISKIEKGLVEEKNKSQTKTTHKPNNYFRKE